MTPPKNENHVWNDERYWVLKSIEDGEKVAVTQRDELRDALRRIEALEKDVTRLNVKSGLWGTVGGAITLVVMKYFPK